MEPIRVSKRMVDFNEVIRPVLSRLERKERLTKGEMILLLIDKILNPTWRGTFTNLAYEPEPIPIEAKKILVIQTSSIGDVVYTTPALKGLREKYQESKISVLTSEISRSLLFGNPDIDEVLSFPKERCLKDLRDGDKEFWRIVLEVYTPIKELQLKRFNLVINLSVTPMSAFLTRLIGGDVVSGLTVDDFGRPKVKGCLWCLYTYYIKANRVMHDLNRLNLAELHLRMADVNPSKRELFISLEKEIEERCSKTLSTYGIKDDLIIGLNPGAGFRSRCWLKERFARLGDILSRRYGAKIIIFGGNKEEGLAHEIVSMMEIKPINLAGKTSLKEMAAYLKRCNHLITNDTCAMHIAAAMHTPVIGICGPTLVGPLGKDGHLLLRAELDCIGCGTTSLCTRGDCMKAITVEAVLAALMYQRKELKGVPEIDGIKIYAAGCKEPGRFFFYHPLNKGEEDVEDEVLRLSYLSLWIMENNRFGFLKEEEIGIKEMASELERIFSHNEIARGIEKVIDRLREYEDFCNEVVSYLKNSYRNESYLYIYKKVESRLYEGIGRLFSLYDLLYKDSSEGDYISYSLRLCKLKSKASLYMRKILEGLRCKDEVSSF